MKSAELVKNRGTTNFKVTIKNDSEASRKIRALQGIRKTGLYEFYLPHTEANTEFLIDNEFEFGEVYKAIQEKEYESMNPIKKIPKYKKKGLVPYNYQIDGINYIEYQKGRALIADVMGLGKTIQALAWIQYRKDVKKVLIVCPSSLKINWSEEFKKWVTRKFKIQILSGKTPYEIKGDVVIVNYDILHPWVIDLKLTTFDLVIADEGHYIKAPKSQRTKAFEEITKTVPYFVMLTGTPIENDPMEIYYLVKLINKNIFPNYIRFITRYCGAKQEQQLVRGGMHRAIWKRNGFTNQKELNRILKKHVMIRRTIDDVDLQLPPKIYADIHLAIDNDTAYQKAEQDFIRYIKEKFDAKMEAELDAEIDSFDDEAIQEIRMEKVKKLQAIERAPALAKIQELKILAAKGKVAQVIEWIGDFLETDEKLIVFAVNKIIIKAIMDAFPAAVKIDGSTSTTKRNEAVKSFQNDADTRLFVGNIKAAGVGLTLTASSNVAIVQFPWNPGEILQAEGRSLRIGQTAKHVRVYKFIAKDTIEERIVKLLQYKQDEIDQIIDGKDVKYKQGLVKLLIDTYR